ncbi:hypothetical protein Q8W71_13810 [Methylobacterium sp. NEAU 140]|uniref:phage baseplate plug family protein n=1 Tax=Methylobacterium sp. NEAU 140 TaxID=3064945 RepID=UPI00273335EA|nr:hypothetical protein [Methylobacterium sp. NEAU 140]MDP4023707.1 hypothetical protein [Methylobacterium sp. NEAU 140]
MQIIPLQPVPNQAVAVTLGGQPCQINVRQTLYGLTLDLYVREALIIGGALVLDRNRVVRSAYLGFSGDLMTFDTQGTDDPVSTGLGSRFLLAYLTASEVIDG